jgi:hypothetical protein
MTSPSTRFTLKTANPKVLASQGMTSPSTHVRMMVFADGVAQRHVTLSE